MITEFLICPKCDGVATPDNFMFTADSCIYCYKQTNLGLKAGDHSDQQHLQMKEGSENLPLPAPILI